MRPTLEICAADIDSVVAAARGGADRVELCSALSEGGVTPSAGLLAEALTVPGIKVNVLIRPRGGDFLYTRREAEVMIHDIRLCGSYGAHGVVIGALTADGDIDIELCRRLVDAAGSMSVTFHRAFDVCRDPAAALEHVIGLGCDRLLSSGQAASALRGAATLKGMVARADGRIAVMAGGGVTPENAAELIRLTGAPELHASAKQLLESGMRYRKAGVNMGTPGADEYARQSTSEQTVARLVASLSRL